MEAMQVFEGCLGSSVHRGATIKKGNAWHSFCFYMILHGWNMPAKGLCDSFKDEPAVMSSMQFLADRDESIKKTIHYRHFKHEKHEKGSERLEAEILS